MTGMDFSSVSAGRKPKPVHPDEVLLKDFIEPMGLSRYMVARGTGVAQPRIDEICAGQRAITADSALRLGRFFGMDAQVWMNFQDRNMYAHVGNFTGVSVDSPTCVTCDWSRQT